MNKPPQNRSVAIALAALALSGAGAVQVSAQSSYPNVSGLTAFTQEANFMSLPGYLRYRYFLESGRWISREEAENAVRSGNYGTSAPVSAPQSTPERTTAVESVVAEDSDKPVIDAATPVLATTDTTVIELPSGLKYQDLAVGKGAVATAGQNVTVHYRGTLTDGTLFDESYKRGEPFTFGLGAGQVIQGWDEGVAGMRIGGKRRLTIPPTLGYGASGAGDVIPPNATLMFDVELLEVG